MKKVDKVAVFLKQLARNHDGLLFPEQVVDAARPPESPLHSKFEWNNGKAAHKYRLWQARQLLRVTVEQIPESKEPIEVFVSLRSDREKGGYRIQSQVLSDSEMRRMLLSDALEELSLFREKYARLKELAEVFAAIRKSTRKYAR